jgi:hypothetical protein
MCLLNFERLYVGIERFRFDAPKGDTFTSSGVPSRRSLRQSEEE